MTQLTAEEIAKCSLHQAKHFPVQLSQTKHRLNICQHFNIQPGSRVLEIGCGQGDTTAVLAALVGERGHVDAIDPGRPDYGSPYTLAQAQSHLCASSLGRQITFHFAQPIDFLQEAEPYDVIVLVHCIWYFSDPRVLPAIIAAAQSKTKHIAIAEYAASASLAEQVPHVLIAFARAAAHLHVTKSEANIQTIHTPSQIASVMQSWTCLQNVTITPDEDLDDGRWEVSSLPSPDSSPAGHLVQALCDAARTSSRVRTMDVHVSLWSKHTQ